ncbi:10586_t:CDS:2, partial [Acaulospora colombiana]
EQPTPAWPSGKSNQQAFDQLNSETKISAHAFEEMELSDNTHGMAEMR